MSNQEIDSFPARVSKSGASKVLVIPASIAGFYEIGDTVQVELRKQKRKKE